MPYFPPDSRYLTEYRSSCEITQDLAKQAGVQNSRDLSIWLQKNAKKLQTQGYEKVQSDLQKFNAK
jgi:aspartate 1-decarboxylase